MGFDRNHVAAFLRLFFVQGLFGAMAPSKALRQGVVVRE